MSRTKLSAVLIAAILITSVIAVDQAFADNKEKKPKKLSIKDRVEILEANATAQQIQIGDLQAGLDLSTINSAIAALGAQIADILATLTSHEDRITALENAPGGATYDDTEVKARLTTLELKTKPFKFGSQGAQTFGVTAPVGQSGKIFFAAVDNGNCLLNSVDIQPGNGDFRQYGWCPQSQVDSFLMPNSNVTENSVITITIGSQPLPSPSFPAPINCWTDGGKNFTVNDGQTGDPLVVEGFFVQCNGFTRTGMTMQATIDNP